MINKTTRFAVYALTILLANYLSDLFFQKLSAYKEPNYMTVFYGMLILVAVYVPCFSILEKYVKKAAKGYVHSTKRMAGNSHKGLLVGMIVAFSTLFYLYAKLWIGRDFIAEWLAVFS